MSRFNPALIFLLAAFLILLGRLPAITAPPWDIDEGLYASVGQALSRGDLLYVDVWDNKPPGIYFVFQWLGGISSDYSLPRVLATAILIASSGLVFYLARRSFGSAKAYASLALFSFFAIVPILETHVTNAEIFLILPTSMAFFLTTLIEWQKWDRRYYILIGALLGFGFLFKSVAIFDGLALASFLVFRYRLSAAKDILNIILGGLAVLFVPAGYLIGNNLTQDFVRAVFLNNLGYIRAGNLTTISFIDINNPLITIGGKVLALAAAVFIVSREFKRPSYRELFYLWLSFTIFGALLSGRPYMHYLITALPAAALLIPDFWVSAWQAYRERGFEARVWIKGGAVITGIVLTLLLGFAGKIQLILASPEVGQAMQGYYGNAYRYFTGQISQSEYFDFYGEVVTLNGKLTDWLKLNSTPQDHLFIWGNAPWVYYLSQRPPASKYLTAYHLAIVKEAPGEVAGDLSTNPPRFIVVTNEPPYIADVGVPTPTFPELDKIITSNYHLADRVAQADIYERNYLAVKY